MIQLHKLILKDSLEVSFLFMSLLNKTHEDIVEREFFWNMFTEREKLESNFIELRKSTNFIEIKDIVQHDEGTLFFKLEFKGSAGYTGAEFSKELGTYFTSMKIDVMLYLMMVMKGEIEEVKDEYFKLLSN